MGRTVG
jgi:hypothetical protein